MNQPKFDFGQVVVRRIRCKDCGYPRYRDICGDLCVPPEIIDPDWDYLDLFDVVGADDGHVICPACGNEFPVNRGARRCES